MLVSCSHKSKRRVFDDQELMSVVDSKWFKVNPEHSLQDHEGNVQTHLFFDLLPEFKEKEKLTNIILTTMPNSEHAYDLDLSSGQKFYSHSYCPQDDVWKKYGSAISRPSFGIGFVPRVLDQLGYPQKVIFFTNRDLSQFLDHHSFRARIVAAYVEQSCPEGNCLGKEEKWRSRLVLLAVDHEDPRLTEVINEDTFSKKFPWKRIEAELENIDGRSFIGDKTYPLIRIRGAIDFKGASETFRRNAVFITQDEGDKIQKNCHKIYEKLWKEVGEEPAGKNPPSFGDRFKKFTKKYFKEAATCEKFVYHGNINRNPEKFWFLSYIGIYYRLHKEGHYFNCNTKSWYENTADIYGERSHDLKRDIEGCTEKDLDTAFGYIPNYLRSLRNHRSYYRFIDYDDHPYGSHRKLYSWNEMRSYKYDCSNDPNTLITKELDVFPSDISWRPRATTNGRRNREAIIQ
jgi:hypothetical protein